MKNLQKGLLVLFCLFGLSIASSCCTLACDSPGNYTCESAFGGSAEPFAEKTGYRYKIENGKRYKRLWSYTKQQWIWPEWVLA